MDRNNKSKIVVLIVLAAVAVLICVIAFYQMGKEKGTKNEAGNEVEQEISVNDSEVESEPVIKEYDEEKSNKYREAKSLFTEGKYEEAKEIYSSIAGYSDSDEMIKECEYKKAFEVLEAEEYTGAAILFENLGDYKDSTEKVNECYYRFAKQSIEFNMFDDAKEMFESLGDYRDSSYMVNVCDMEHGMQLVREGYYEQAVPYFVELLNDEEWMLEFSKNGRLQDETDVSGYDLNINSVVMKRQVFYYAYNVGGIIIDYIDDDDIPDRYRVRPVDKESTEYDYGDYEFDGNWNYLSGTCFRD